MIRTARYFAENQFETDISLEQVKQSLHSSDEWVWVVLEHPSEAEVQEILADTFHFHPLAIEDCLSTGYQTPKLDDYTGYIFLILHALKSQAGEGPLELHEINLFLGENFLVACSMNDHIAPVDHIWSMLVRDERLHLNGVDFLCHAIIDRLVDEYMPILDGFEDEIEILEDAVLARPAPIQLQQLLELKHQIMYFRRVLSPQREILNKLSRDEYPMVDRQSQIYFRDIYDHLVRLQELSESQRDIITSTLDIYLNSTSLRLNEVMKALTIVSTIFLPLSFLAGVYGMNFEYMPELTWKYGYYGVWGLFIMVIIGMLAFFRKRNWF